MNASGFPTVNLPINDSHQNCEHYHNQDLNQSEQSHVPSPEKLLKHKQECFPALFRVAFDFVIILLERVVGGSVTGAYLIII